MRGKFSRTLNLQLVGTTPIILHNVSRHQLREQIASRSGSSLSLEEEALEVMSKDNDGNPAVPVSWLSDAIRVGCSRITVEGKQISFFKLQSVVQLPEGMIPLRDTDNHIPIWKVYSSIQHAAPKSNRSIAVVAPMFKDWMLTVQAVVTGELISGNDVLNEVVLEKIFAEAGKVGIGLFHPPKKQFGQFRVDSIL
jgi:hypothetical protein